MRTSASLLGVAALTLSLPVYAQRVEPATEGPAIQPKPHWQLVKNAAYLEFMGPGVLLTVNYERMLGPLALRLGAGGLPPGDSSQDSYLLTLPLTINYLGLRVEHVAVDLGLGPVVTWTPSHDKEYFAYGPRLNIGLTGVLGFRWFFGSRSGTFARFAYTPMLGPSGFANWFGVALGYAWGGPPPPDQCHKVASCNDQGVCTYAPKPDGTRCNDGDACTRTDQCIAGRCVGDDPVVCTAFDQCSLPGVCIPSSGACTNPPKPDGAHCDDANKCTRADRCEGGRCVGTPLVCTATNSCHAPGVCEPETGWCTQPVLPNGTGCSPGDICTVGTCEQGACLFQRPLSCDDNDSCTADACNAATGCTHRDVSELITLSNGTTRRTLTSALGHVDLFRGVPGNAACTKPWSGRYTQRDEPNQNDCGPTAAMNLYDWYGISMSYPVLESRMRTNDWESGPKLTGACLINCGLDPFCSVACYEGITHIVKIGTLPGDMRSALAAAPPAGYHLAASQGKKVLNELEASLKAGNPIVVLISPDEYQLHWSVITGTYDAGGVTMVRFANAPDVPWDAFVEKWSLRPLGNPAIVDAVGIVGIERYIMMHYER